MATVKSSSDQAQPEYGETVTATERIFRDGVLVAIPGTVLTAEQAQSFGIKPDGTKDADRADVSPYDRPGASAPASIEVTGQTAPAETAAEQPASNAAEAPATDAGK